MCYPTVFPLFCFMFEGISKYKALGAYFRRRDLTEGFLRTSSEERGLVFGGTYLRNISIKKSIWVKFQP